jgi:hypothetical protein
MATITGIGGFCNQNWQYKPVTPATHPAHLRGTKSTDIRSSSRPNSSSFSISRPPRRWG